MPKWLLFGLAAIIDLVIAVFAYRSGRVLVPAILALACVFFIVAAIGSLKETKNLKR
jgi:hypothetical protein